MYTLFSKEIKSFFSNLTGYIVIVVFLVINGLFMWVFPGANNVLDAGYANMDTLFSIAPWIFLFLVPAITMRMFADEKKSGTIELLLTRPIGDFSVILSKYLAALVLVLLALIPTLVYFWSIYFLGNPVGNLDTGGIVGSYIGLFFLAAIYAAVGLFSSLITDNSIIAFIVAVVISFFLYTGFESISSLPLFGSADSKIAALGINAHYNSISRGVIDSRDIIYFLSAIILFLYGGKLVLASRKWS